MRKEDDPELLKAERDSADRDYNDALTRLDRAIQQIPASFPHPPPPPDEHQITPLNQLWTLAAPPAGDGLGGRFAAAVRRVTMPFFERQQAFNSAVVDHINRNLAVGVETRASIETTLAALREHIEAAATFESLLVIFLQRITPYVDTRDRSVAGLLRGLSAAINAVADETMKRTETLLARERTHERRVAALEEEVAALRSRLDELTQSRRTQPPDHG